ncbi:hypothetical protein [Alcaligenes endophyticus]|uniref:N,N-dimethylformamidase alpha subunit domain-containing protein n=1 Tax=Alcaligenes endophyticus TaxID=1929088 RepID=A0ABT8EIN6_9BURK|nr:hypothetical protein [Alcaligenes endophyticus]MCX5592407.1 hypothetical protein [Alcaligenes endophyticus]MDN4121132.1 hypothetical protein [Alcaligenes endophyticus]
MSWHQNESTSPFLHMSQEQALSYAKEFMDAPTSRPFSEGLQRILNRFHGSPLNGRYVLVQITPWKEWQVGRLKGRAQPVEIVSEDIHTSLEDGERAIFRLCWLAETGKALPF